MRQTIHATEQELKRIFSDDYFFRIPGYQRPYSWTRDHTATLLQDLIDSLPDDGVGMQEASPYFLGSIVLMKDPNYPEADVVDGQQRLTTLTILLAALRDLSAAGAADALHKYICELGDKFSGTEDRFRLQLRPRDRPFFREQVQSPNGTTLYRADDRELSDSQRNIQDNARFLVEQLTELGEERRDQLAMFLLQRCYLVVVSASDQASAYRIFSVMNDRGMDLEPTDILKADIIGGIPQEQEQHYTELWEGLEEDLGRDRFADLFGHIRMIHRKAKARQALMQEIRETLQPERSPRDFIDHTLVPMARAFRTIENADYGSAAEALAINRHLTVLNRLDNSDWLPPAIAFISRFESRPAQVRTFLQDLERLAYALFILRAPVNERMERYIRVLDAMDRSQPLDQEESPLQLSFAEKQRVQEALDGPLYTQVQLRLPILLRLEDELAESESVTSHPRIVSVEQVLPSSPPAEGEWAQRFPDAASRKEQANRLGNLVLMPRTKNPEAQKWDFARKKAEYLAREGETPFALTAQVLEVPEWTPEALDRRHRQLVGLLARAWRLT
ncbi:hypothetical protein AN478_03040 [Thiohalorhabdus denitrificans]|uniref:DUF262 domain-containing protein n=1 Tax=Thiohalorhabdus denitrificans TaxID=381306 RepID=A0A0P9C8G2_9GAMM|nr:DUF262 domain-containing protein [Thiohalorhabdus denitrificans]KPV41552.1 hypothetical protein AN478_03040 [Thiohalorhabdus denitrificans]SCY31455.1 Protein of unknown function [Thiohalorhabdus denitrificans]